MPGERAFLLLVEGVTGLGKSTLLDRLLRQHVTTAPERKLRTVLHLTQAHTYGPLAPAEDAGTLTREASVAHLERVVALLEWLAATVRDERVPKCFALVDTLHLTHCVRPGVLAWDDVAPYDRRLAGAGCRLILLDAEDETVRERAVRAPRGDGLHPRLRDAAVRAGPERAGAALRERARRLPPHVRRVGDAQAPPPRRGAGRVPGRGRARVLARRRMTHPPRD